MQPHICLLHSVHFSDEELAATPWLAKLGERLESLPVHDALLADLHAVGLLDDVGSLLRPQLSVDQIAQVREAVAGGQSLFTQELNDRILDALDQLEYLARKYHVVVANPPYFGKSMSDALSDFVKSQYPESKSDLFAAFIERNLDFTVHGGLVAMITMQSWMFLSSYEKLRTKLLANDTLLAVAHLGARAFDSIGGEVVSTTAFVVENAHRPTLPGSYVRLVDGSNEAEKEAALRQAL